MGADLHGASGLQQLTIFYSGSVKVCDQVPAHKVRAIMLLLSDHHNGDSSLSHRTPESSMQMHQAHLSKSAEAGCAKAGDPPPHLPAPSTPTSGKTQTTQCALQKQHPIVIKRSQAELPFARKASLARFLEKRKYRALEAMEVKTSDVTASCADSNVDILDLHEGSSCKRMKS